MKKGQFFLLGALFFMLMFYLAVSAHISRPFAGSMLKEDVRNLFENVKDEFPRALNFGLNSSKPVSTLINFTNFVMNHTKSRDADFAALWILTQNVSSDLNVTVGNFLGYSTTIMLNVSGNEKEIYVENGKINSTIFLSPPSEFGMNVSFNTTEENLLLEKYKANLYLFLEMRRGGDRIRGEIKA